MYLLSVRVSSCVYRALPIWKELKQLDGFQEAGTSAMEVTVMILASDDDGWINNEAFNSTVNSSIIPVYFYETTQKN